MRSAIIVFVRNPELGKVKTRLAATLGDQAALKVYKELLHHTRLVTQLLQCDRFIFYADYINNADDWDNAIYKKCLQISGDLGSRIKAAFELIFKDGYEKVLIIGSDCYELEDEIVSDAFAKLDDSDVAIGPTVDGGYYLLGMKKFRPALFENIPWSTSSVCSDTIRNIEDEGLTYRMLPVLSDVDEASDVPEYLLHFITQV